MCLLVNQPAGVKLPEDLVRGVFRRNADGIGVMRSEGGVLLFKKMLPRNADEFYQFYVDNIEGRECSWHARMQTHGAIDLENCHPYPVFGFEGEGVDMPVLLMHNGVLSTGNDADLSKSDTWHYIRTYLRPLMKGDIDFAFTREFAKVIGGHIGGSNRFVMLAADGRTTIINKSTGVEHAGAWFSNTYAWDATKFMERKGYSYHGGERYGVYGKYGGEYDNTAYDSWKERHAPTNYGRQGSLVETEVAPGPKSKSQLKRERKKASKNGKGNLATATPATGPKTGPVKAGGTSDEVGEVFAARKEGVPVECVHDVLEMRTWLDTAYPDAPTKDSQLLMLLEVMGVTRCYEALNLLLEGRMAPSTWDGICNSRDAARRFASVDLKPFKDNPQGCYYNEEEVYA